MSEPDPPDGTPPEDPPEVAAGAEPRTPGDGSDSGEDRAGHVPVLLEAVRTLLAPESGETFVDATAGLGGHAAAIAPVLVPEGLVILNDLDPGNLAGAAQRVRAACERAGASIPRIEAIRGNFAYLPVALRDRGLAADMVLADLGFASSQVDDPGRGLSFSREGPLDMRLDPDGAATAADLVNTLPERELADLIYQFGEERASRRIARKIVEARREEPIHTTSRLASIVRAAAGSHRPKKGRGGPRRSGPRIDPATRTFQALRIAVNDEIGSLTALLGEVERAAESLASGSGSESGAGPGARPWLGSGSRVAIIAFHSLEDRPVKHAFVDLAQRELATRLTRKPIRPDEQEAAANPRARSARLRAVRII